MADEFDPFDFVPLFGTVTNKGAGVFTFKRSGRDLGEFTPLLRYGTVRASGNDVTLKLSNNVAEARQRSRDNARRIAELNARFARNEARLAKVDGQGFVTPGENTKHYIASSKRKRSAFARVGEESGRLGFIQMGRSGFTITGDSLRALGGKAFTAGIGLNVVGGGLNQLADTRESIQAAMQQGASSSELPAIVAARAGGAFTRAFGSLSGVESLSRGLLRMGGLTRADADRTVERFYTAASSTVEEIERRRAAQRKVLANALSQAQRVIEADVAKLNEYVPTSFRVRDRFDRERYRENIREANGFTLEAKRDYLENEVRRQARSAVGT